MGIRKIDYGKCSKCGQCIRICPMDVLRRDGETKRPFIAYLSDCQSCFLCELYCPEEAIMVTPHRERRATMPWISN